MAEFATLSLIGHFRRTSHLNQTVQLIASQVRLLQIVLPSLDAAGRRQLSGADAGERGLQLGPDDSHVPRHQPRFRFARHLAVELGERLGEPVLLRHGGPGQRTGLWIGFLAGGELWWLILPPPRFEPQELPADLWLGLAATLAAVLLIAGLFVRGIVRPLARLGDAVAATGDGAAQRVTPEGPREVRRLAARHNTMLDQLATAAAERREMLAGLTHDLRASLARLRLRLALLDSDTERAGIAHDLDDMERIVGQCLQFLRSEEADRAPVPLAIAALLRDGVARQRVTRPGHRADHQRRRRTAQGQDREKAARGTDGRRYPWGDTFDVRHALTWETVAVTGSRSEPVTARPGIRLPIRVTEPLRLRVGIQALIYQADRVVARATVEDLAGNTAAAVVTRVEGDTLALAVETRVHFVDAASPVAFAAAQGARQG